MEQSADGPSCFIGQHYVEVRSTTSRLPGTDVMSRRKQPNPKPLKVGEDDLPSDDDDDDELVIFEESSDGEGDTQDDRASMRSEPAEGPYKEACDGEDTLDSGSTYARARPKRKCTRTAPYDDYDDAGAKRSRTGQTETHELFPCPKCSKGFKAQRELQMHMREHTGEKPFCCPFCNKAYPRRKTMYRHIREQHPEQWQRGRFPGRRYQAAIKKAMEDSMEQWRAMRRVVNWAALGAASSTNSSAHTGPDTSKVSSLPWTPQGQSQSQTPPVTPVKQSAVDALCEKYQKIAPAPLRPQLTLGSPQGPVNVNAGQSPVSSPPGGDPPVIRGQLFPGGPPGAQQYFLVDPQSGAAYPVIVTNASTASTDTTATNTVAASTARGDVSSVAMATNQQLLPQSQVAPAAMPINPQAGMQVSLSSVAMPTNPRVIIQTSVPSVAMPTNPHVVIQKSVPSVAMPTNPQSVVQISPSSVAMPTNPKVVVQMPASSVAMPTNPHVQMQMPASSVAMAMTGASSFPQATPAQTTGATSAILRAMPSSFVTHNQQPPVVMMQQQGTTPTFVPVQNQIPQVHMAPVARAPVARAPVARAPVAMAPVARAMLPPQPAPVAQQVATPTVFPVQKQQSPSIMKNAAQMSLAAQKISTVVMPTSPSSRVATTTTARAVPNIVIMPKLFRVQNQSPQVPAMTVAMATKPSSMPVPILPSQVPMATKASTTPVQNLPPPVAVATTAKGPTPTQTAPAVKQVLIPVQNQQRPVSMAIAVQPSHVAMTTMPSSSTLRSLHPKGKVTITATPQTLVPASATPTVPPVAMATIRSLLPIKNQPQAVRTATVVRASPPANTAAPSVSASLPAVLHVSLGTVASAKKVPPPTVSSLLKTRRQLSPLSTATTAATTEANRGVQSAVPVTSTVSAMLPLQGKVSRLVMTTVVTASQPAPTSAPVPMTTVVTTPKPAPISAPVAMTTKVVAAQPPLNSGRVPMTTVPMTTVPMTTVPMTTVPMTTVVTTPQPASSSDHVPMTTVPMTTTVTTPQRARSSSPVLSTVMNTIPSSCLPVRLKEEAGKLQVPSSAPVPMTTEVKTPHQAASSSPVLAIVMKTIRSCPHVRLKEEARKLRRVQAQVDTVQAAKTCPTVSSPQLLKSEIPDSTTTGSLVEANVPAPSPQELILPPCIIKNMPQSPQQLSAPTHSSPQLLGPATMSAPVTSTSPKLQIQNVVSLLSSQKATPEAIQSSTQPACPIMETSPTMQINPQCSVTGNLATVQSAAEHQTQTISAQNPQRSPVTVARQQVSSATVTTPMISRMVSSGGSPVKVMTRQVDGRSTVGQTLDNPGSQDKKRKVGVACQISQAPHRTIVKSEAANSDGFFPNLEVDSDEDLIVGDEVADAAHVQMMMEQLLEYQKTDAGRVVTLQQIPKFRPILPRTLETSTFQFVSDRPKDEDGQFRSLTVEVLERNNTCPLCGSMLSSVRYLIMHLFKFHQYYKCRLCAPRVTESFSSEHALRNHLLQRHWPLPGFPNKEEATRQLRYNLKRSCQAVDAVHSIGNPSDVLEITNSEIHFKKGVTLKFWVKFNVLIPTKYVNDGDIMVKRTSTGGVSITCMFFHTSSVMKGTSTKTEAVDTLLRGMRQSFVDEVFLANRLERTAGDGIAVGPPNVAVLPKVAGKSFKAAPATIKETMQGIPTAEWLTSLQSAPAETVSQQSTQSVPHQGTAEDSEQTNTEYDAALEHHSCDVCGTVCSGLRQLQEHMNTHIELKPFKCNICSRTFPHGATLEAHVKAHYRGEIDDEPPTIPANVKISFCKEARKGESLGESGNKDGAEDVAEDSATADSEEDEQNDDGADNMCRLCGKTYTNSASLVRHLWTHQQGFKLSCSICGKGFNLSYHLKEHMNVHTKTKPYKCHVCGKSFTHSGTLSAHLKSHKSREGIVAEYRCFSCRYCSVQFAHVKKYLEHLKVRHGIFDFDFEEAERDIITSNSSAAPTTSEDTAMQFSLVTEDISDNAETSVSQANTATAVTTSPSIPPPLTQDNIQIQPTPNLPSPLSEPTSVFELKKYNFGPPAGKQALKTVAELIGLRRASPARAESSGEAATSSGEPPPLVITQAISLRPFVDKIIAASSPDQASKSMPNVTKFKPILPKAYVQSLQPATFPISPVSPSAMDIFDATVTKEVQYSPKDKKMKVVPWKIKDFQAMASTEKQGRHVSDEERHDMAFYNQGQFTKFRYGTTVTPDQTEGFKCNKCGMRYNSELHLKHHICGACSKYMMKCEECDMTFFSFRRLEHHLTMEHPEEYMEEDKQKDESQERIRIIFDKASYKDGQVVIKVEQTEQCSVEPTNQNTAIKQEEVEGQTWWPEVEGDLGEEHDLEWNKMAGYDVKEEREDDSFGELIVDDSHVESEENYLHSSEEGNLRDKCGGQSYDFRTKVKTEVQGQQRLASDKVHYGQEVTEQNESCDDQSETSRSVVPHHLDQLGHRDIFQERRQVDQSYAKEGALSVHQSRRIDQSENMVQDIIQSDQSGQSLGEVHQSEQLDQDRMQVDQSENMVQDIIQSDQSGQSSGEGHQSEHLDQERMQVDQSENMVQDIIQSDQSGQSLGEVHQSEHIGQQRMQVDQSEGKGQEMFKCMLCGPNQDKLLASADLSQHLTGYHHVENPDMFLQGPLSCFSIAEH